MEHRWKDQFIASVAALHGRQLLRFLLARLRNAGDAQDMAQEVYLRLLRLDRPDLIRSPEAYLFTIAAHIAGEHALKRSTHPLHIALQDVSNDELSIDAEDGAPIPEDAAQQNDRLRQLERALAHLSPKARATLIWHRRDGYTYKEIGARLGISSNMVKKYLSQALAHCRESMGAEQGR